MQFNKFVSILLIGLIAAACGRTEKKPASKTEITNNDQYQADAQYVENASFTDFDGNTVKVSDFKGKVVMIDFWETWCKPCLASFPTLEKLQNEYPDDFVVLAVTPGFTDTQKDAQNFASKHDYTFHYLMDTGKLSEKLKVQGIPFKVYVDPQGKFLHAQMGSYGPQGDYKKIKKIIEDHKPASSTD